MLVLLALALVAFLLVVVYAAGRRSSVKEIVSATADFERGADVKERTEAEVERLVAWTLMFASRGDSSPGVVASVSDAAIAFGGATVVGQDRRQHPLYNQVIAGTVRARTAAKHRVGDFDSGDPTKSLMVHEIALEAVECKFGRDAVLPKQLAALTDVDVGDAAREFVDRDRRAGTPADTCDRLERALGERIHEARGVARSWETLSDNP